MTVVFQCITQIMVRTKGNIILIPTVNHHLMYKVNKNRQQIKKELHTSVNNHHHMKRSDLFP